MRYVYQAYTDKGGRTNNEDKFALGKSKNGYLFLVADGLGGYGKGEIASGLVCEEIFRQFNIKAEFDLNQAILHANYLLIEKQKELGIKMKTTLVAAWVRKKTTVLVHVGDSRIYAFGKSGIIFQTEDHSAAQLSLRVQESDTDVRRMEERNILTRALGMSEEVELEQQELENFKYDRLLLCSDGFWEYVFENEMIDSRRKWQSPRAWLNKMQYILRSKIHCDNDNNTAIAVMKRRI